MMVPSLFLVILAAWTGTGLPFRGEAGEDPGGRVLRKEIVVRAPIEAVWRAWTTNDGLKFVSRKSNVELRVGGPYEWFLDGEPDERGRRGGQGARILAFAPHEMLSFDWTFPPSIPSLRAGDARTRVTVRFEEIGNGRVRVDFTQAGWQEGEDWDAGYAYFDEAWSFVLDRLQASLESGPAGSGAEGRAWREAPPTEFDDYFLVLLTKGETSHLDPDRVHEAFLGHQAHMLRHYRMGELLSPARVVQTDGVDVAGLLIYRGDLEESRVAEIVGADPLVRLGVLLPRITRMQTPKGIIAWK